MRNINWITFHKDTKPYLYKNEEVPTTRLIVYASIGHFLATGKQLFEGFRALCSDVSSNGYSITVGSFRSLYIRDHKDTGNLYVTEGYEDSRSGLATIVNPQFPLEHGHGLYPNGWSLTNYEPSSSQKIARVIMGKNYFGVEEADLYFNVEPTPAQISALATIPYTEAKLREVKDTHILVAVFPLSILEIRKKNSELFDTDPCEWLNTQAFAMNRGKKPRWQLVGKIPKGRREPVAKNEEIPTSRVMVYTTIGYFLKNWEWLFIDRLIQCSDLDSEGKDIYIGDPGRGSLRICADWFYISLHRECGRSSARKFE